MSDDRLAQIVTCPRCGAYEIAKEIVAQGHTWPNKISDPLSCAARQASEGNRPIRITFENAETLARPHAESRVVDNQDRLLREVAKRSGRPQKTCVLLPGSDFTLIDCFNNNEFLWYIESLVSLGLLERPAEGATFAHNLKLTPEGWKRIQPVTQIGGIPGQCFVAMWFSDETRSAYDEAIEPAVREAGCSPIRIDRKEHNNEITDEIIAEIRNSQFVVADFTGQRPGVYYEAGFAMGLGRKVIWCCRKDEIGKLHFDTNHKNHIDWESLEELKQRLYRRIRATILDEQ